MTPGTTYQAAIAASDGWCVQCGDKHTCERCLLAAIAATVSQVATSVASIDAKLTTLLALPAKE